MAHSKRVQKQLPLFSTDSSARPARKKAIAPNKPTKKIKRVLSASTKVQKKTPQKGKLLRTLTVKKKSTVKIRKKRIPVEKGKIELRFWSELLNEKDSVQEKEKTLFFHSKAQATKAVQEVYALLKKYSY